MKRLLKRWLAGALMAVIAAGTLAWIPAEAAAPSKKEVEYEGYGKVEVEFKTGIERKNMKITVIDSTGKSYKIRNVKVQKDEIDFQIWNFKQGETYRYSISGIRKAGSCDYAAVTGIVKIPMSKVTERKAIKLAIADAVKKYKVKESALKEKDLELTKYRNRTVYKVKLKFRKNGSIVEYEYWINRTSGKILRRDTD